MAQQNGAYVKPEREKGCPGAGEGARGGGWGWNRVRGCLWPGNDAPPKVNPAALVLTPVRRWSWVPGPSNPLPLSIARHVAERGAISSAGAVARHRTCKYNTVKQGTGEGVGWPGLRRAGVQGPRRCPPSIQPLVLPPERTGSTRDVPPQSHCHSPWRPRKRNGKECEEEEKEDGAGNHLQVFRL